MMFHADSESDFKSSPNQVKNQILSKNRFTWYFDLKLPLRKDAKTPDTKLVIFFSAGRFYLLPCQGGSAPPDPPGGGPRAPPGVKKREKSKKVKFPLKKTPKKPKIKISKIVDTSGPNF